MTISNRAAWAVGLGLLGAAGLVVPTLSLGQNTPAAAEKPGPAVVGCVDMEAVITGYDEYKVNAEKLKGEALARQKELTDLISRGQQIAREMQSLAPGSPEYKVKDDEVTALTAKLEAEKGKAQRDFAQKDAEAMAEVFKKVQEMVRLCAQSKGMTYVVRVSNGPVTAVDHESLRDAIARTVVYSDPKTDITKMVTFNLNDRYHKQNPNVKVPQHPGPTAGNPGQAQDGAVAPASATGAPARKAAMPATKGR